MEFFQSGALKKEGWGKNKVASFLDSSFLQEDQRDL